MSGFLKALARRYGEDEISNRAAALSYFAIFSIGPLLFVVFGLLGVFLREQQVKQRIVEQLEQSVGPEAGPLITQVADSSYLADKAGVAFLIGGIGLVMAAIGIFGQMQKSFNGIFKVKTGPGAGIKAVIKQKFLSLGLVGVVSFMFLVSLLASAAVSVATSYFDGRLYTGLPLHLIDFLVSLFILSLLLTAVYRTLPDIKLPWKVLFATSFFVALFFTAGKTILSQIIAQNTTASAFGAAGSLIALLLWIFYSAQLIYLGASGASLYAETRGLKLEPRYKGYRGVLRIRRVEEPLGKSSLKEELKNKFIKGIARGWGAGPGQKLKKTGRR